MTPKLLLALLLLSFSLTCRPWEKGDASKAPPSLVILDGARELDYRIGQGVHSFSYQLAETYPAASTINAISERVAVAGFTPLREHPMNPGLLSCYVRGWGDYIDGTRTPEMRVFQWMADWLGPNGEWLEYSLTYEYPDRSSPNVSILKVAAVLMPKDHADAAIASAAGSERVSTLPSLLLPRGTAPVARGREP